MFVDHQSPAALRWLSVFACLVVLAGCEGSANDAPSSSSATSTTSSSATSTTTSGTTTAPAATDKSKRGPGQWAGESHLDSERGCGELRCDACHDERWAVYASRFRYFGFLHRFDGEQRHQVFLRGQGG